MTVVPTVTKPMFHHDRHDPFGTIGGQLAGVTDAATANRLGGLDWKVETHPFTSTIVDEARTELSVDGVTFIPERTQTVTSRTKRQVIRRNPDGSVLGLNAVVGSGYQPIQHDAVTDLIQNIVDSSDLQWKAAGSTHGGLRAFWQVALPEHIVIGGGNNSDKVDMSLVVQTRHDGTGALVGTPTAFRFWCTNLLPALRHSSVRFSVQHTKAAEVRIAEIRAALGMTFKAAEEIKVIGNKLVDAKMTSKEFLDLVDVIYPLEKDKAGEVTAESHARQRKVVSIFNDEPDQANIRGTRWGALQAVLAYEDWHRPTQGKQEIHKARRIVNRQQDGVKFDAMHLLLAGV